MVEKLIATKAPRHKAKREAFYFLFIFAPWCLGGESAWRINGAE
jgi:hypothetical protein